MPGCDILADNKEENPLLTWEFGFLLRKNKGGKSSPHIGVRIFASQKLGGLKMHKELEVMKPRSHSRDVFSSIIDYTADSKSSR